MRTSVSMSSLGGQREARSSGKVTTGANGTATMPSVASAAHSATKTDTASPFATGRSRRSHSLERALELEAGGPEDRTEPRVEDTPRRFARKQHDLGREDSDRNLRSVGVLVRGRERRKQRLISERVDTNAVVTRRRWRLLHDRCRQVVCCKASERVGRDLLIESNREVRVH